MKKLLTLLTLFFVAQSFAQSYPFKISGTIQSEKDKSPIESATIHLERVKDSSVISYTISDEKGRFNLEGKSFYKDVKMVVSFVGMKNYEKLIPANQLKNYNAGTIGLTEENMLDEVVVKSRAPITIKKDTLEFNVKSFKTKKDANVEDLLKKLPGVEVDAEGKITVNGKPVNKILVNGKPFFGNDPSITTKNLTKEIIEKVQITDTKTKSEGFTGEDGDKNNKTINLTIKKENNKGWFGRVSAGGGTDERYEAATMVNRFDNNQRFSVLAGGNNINSPGFSFGEIQKMFGGNSMSFSSNGSFRIGGRSFGGGSGIVKSRTGGATYADEYAKGFDVNANYFYSGSNSEDVSKTNRENILPDTRYFTNSNANSNNENDNHSIELEFDIEIDPTFLINIEPRFVLNKRNGNFSRTESSSNEDQVLTNNFESSSRSESTAKNFQNEIEITKKLDTLGSFIKASITNQFDKSTTDDFNNSTIEVFGSNPSTTERNQYSDIENDLNRFSTRFTYRYPIIAKKLFLDAKYRYENTERENVESTFDFNTTAQDFTDFNTDLSSNFTYNDISQRPSLRLSYRGKKMSSSFEAGYISRTLESDDKLRPNLNLKRTFGDITLNSSFSYRFDSKASLYIDYSLRNNAPSIRQIQPFTDVTNPTNIITGNENLRPSKNHGIYLGFNKFNWQKRTGFHLYGGGDYQQDQVVSNRTIGDDLVSNTTYTNESGAYNFWGGGRYNFGMKLDSISNLKIDVGANFNANKNISLINNVVNSGTTRSIGPSLGLTYDWNKVISIIPRYRINFSNTKYNVNPQQNQSFTTHTFNLRTKTNIPKKLEWSNDVRYNYNPNLVGFNKSSWFWNSTLAYSILKDKATITLKGYDLLNQNTNARRIANGNFIQDSESTVLQQYFMLGFSWKFNSLGKKGQVRDSNFIIF